MAWQGVDYENDPKEVHHAMCSIFISMLLFSPVYYATQLDEVSGRHELQIIMDELDLALNSFFSLLDEQDLDVFVAGVRHAARARLLLEQHLGEDIDDLSSDARQANPEEFQLRLIAKRAAELAGEAGRELWRQDYYDKQWAMMRLTELDNMVKGLKKSISK